MRNTLSLLIAVCGLSTLTSLAQFKPYDTETPSYVQFTSPRYEVSQTETNAVVTIVRSGDFRQLAAIEYTTREGTAEDAVDFVASGGKVVFAAGQSFRTITIPILRGGDPTPKTFQVEMTQADVNTIVTTPTAQVEIKPQPPALTIAVKGNALEVSWPDSGQPFALEAQADGQWSSVAGAALIDGTWRASFQNAGAMAWFRLRLAPQATQE
jgi:hypothetical protein